MNQPLMYIDCHTHSYPLAIPGAFFWNLTPRYTGLKINDLESTLRKKEDITGVRHGVFYGGNDYRTIPKAPKSSYLKERVLPMIENHVLQVIGVLPWRSVNLFKDFASSYEDNSEIDTQIKAIKYLVDNGGIAIIDQPSPIYEDHGKTNSVFLKHKGEATVNELKSLTKKYKNRTFLCYDGILPSLPGVFTPRKSAEELSDLTGIKLLGGSDAIIRPSSLFTTYTEARLTDIRDILNNPNSFGEIHKGAAPFYNLERFQRCATALWEEKAQGLKKREEVHERMIQKWLEKNK